MLVYKLALEMVAMVQSVVVPRLRGRRRSLVDQVRRAGDSVVLNIAEGRSSRGKRKAAHFQIALGSARETLAVVDLSVALGLAREAEVEQLRDRLDHISAILWRLTHG